MWESSCLNGSGTKSLSVLSPHLRPEPDCKVSPFQYFGREPGELPASPREKRREKSAAAFLSAFLNKAGVQWSPIIALPQLFGEHDCVASAEGRQLLPADESSTASPIQNSLFARST